MPASMSTAFAPPTNPRPLHHDRQAGADRPACRLRSIRRNYRRRSHRNSCGPDRDRSRSLAGAARPPPSVARAERGPPSEAIVAEILARPLFSATRRPPAKSEGATGDSGLADTRLAGIVTTPGRRFAIFAPNGAKPLIVNEGDTISGWHIDRITPREVSLTGPTGTKTLQPKIDPTLVPPAPPPGAAPPPASPPNNPAFVPPTRPGFPAPPANRLPIRRGQPRQSL